jgi:phage baseplate assembly protein W
MDWSYLMNSAISLPFSFNEAGAISSTNDPAKIWQDRVIIAVMTGLKERVMRPTYGSDVHSTVGENLSDALSIIRQSITVTFSRWLKDLVLVEVIGSVDEYDGYLIVQIKYNYRNLEQTQTVNIKTAVLSRSGDILLEVSKND